MSHSTPVYERKMFELQRFSVFFRRMAPSLLFLLASCLVPVDPPVIDAGGLASNHPPAITPELLSPPEGSVSLNANCPEHAFSLGAIYEQDREDLLFIRWFIDFDAETHPSFAQDGLVQSAGVSSLRPGPTFLLQPGSARQFPNGVNIGADSEGHRLEVLVSDRNFIPGLPGSSVPNQTVPTDAQTDRVWWQIEFTDDTDCDDGATP
jgi:hypothetical protein